MNTDRELMQQWLDAIAAIPEDVEGYLPDALTDVVIATRERLAQPQMQPCAGRNCGSTNPNLHSAECFEDYEKATGMNQRKPLTDEQLEVLWDDATDRMEHFCSQYWDFARAIEKAHGIGEKPDAA